MNVVLLGKGSLAIKVAEWFKENTNLLYVVPDMPEPTWTDSMIEWCKNNNVDYIESGDYNDIPDVDIDLAMSVFYGNIIKQNFIDSCRNIINLHNSPLPKYRGVRPINWALKNGEHSHGVTIHKIDKGVDTGEIIGQVTYPIYPEIEEVEDVYSKALDYGWMLFKDVAKNLTHAINHAKPQGENFSYYPSEMNHLLGDRSDFRR